MSQPPASSSVVQNSQANTPTDSDNFKIIFEAALEAYKKKTKQSLEGHTLLTQLQTCDSPAAILDLLRGQVNPNADEGLKTWLNPTINVLYTFSATLGGGVGLIFPPATVVFAGIGVLLLAAKDLNEDQDTLVEIFENIKNFFRRLEIYADVPPTPAMKDTMVEIMVEVLDVLGIATKEIKKSQAKKFLKKLAGWTEMKDALKKLDKLTDQGDRMASAQVLKNTHVVDVKLTRVDEKVERVGTQVENITDEVQRVSKNLDGVKRNKLRQSLRTWQSPPDPSINHNVACDRQHKKTTEWFTRGGVFKKWKATGSLLWIHGKPGSGKTVLCSAIIEDIATLHKAGLASMAYFYFDFRDIDKQSRRNLLPSLLVQLSARSDPRCDVLSDLYEAHDDGACQPSDSALTQCLKEMLTLPDQGPVYLILDALDECPNTSEFPSTRRRVLDLVKELSGLQLPNLHICITSRPEVDIRDVIEPLAFHPVSLHDERGQKEDITTYIRSVVYSDSGAAMSRWRVEEKKLVIKTLSDRADGMFRWVYCQLEVLQNCLPGRVRKKLSELPKTLDETYERILKEIGKADGDLARRILQCLAVASRPLRVEELADILALDFEEAEGGIPEFNEDLPLQDRQQALMITCSSLIVIVDDHGSRLVQFSHFSVKEFLTSNRLATPVRDISSFHLLPEPAHAILAQACLAVLLNLDDSISKDTVQSSFPLAQYAAEHWVDHAQFEKVSLRIKDGMRRLFDKSGPYFSGWLRLHDIDSRDPWYEPTAKLVAAPLYYASLCGFRDLAEHLVVKSPQDVNARGGRHHSPLAAALRNCHFHVAELLRQRGADIELASDNNRTLLVDGHVDAVQWQLEHGANVNPQQNDSRTSSPEGVGVLRKHSGLANAANDHGDSPLHLASTHDRFKTIQLLIQRGADVTARNNRNLTPLHLLSSLQGTESMQMLIQYGADVNARDEGDSTPLHLASSKFRAEPMRLLIQHGADVNARDKSNSTPLHVTALTSGRMNYRDRISKSKALTVLIQHGADVNAQGEGNSTPLHLAVLADCFTYFTRRHIGARYVEVLLKHGADVDARDNQNSTPLHLAAQTHGINVTRLLLSHGANADAEDIMGQTPYEVASSTSGRDSLTIAQIISGHRKHIREDKIS